ncbi:MAG TPA: hypothetical protein DIU15_16850, partial [Deltaproteobacteria bacterium]|nr:hypothetical protein [Deltaproteobacteria bacterium]
MPFLLLFCLSLLGLSCVQATPNSEERTEGQFPGECNDEADNDSDGYYDCLDSDCYGAPNCLDGDDDDD